MKKNKLLPQQNKKRSINAAEKEVVTSKKIKNTDYYTQLDPIINTPPNNEEADTLFYYKFL